ncbi:hypothetical protein COW99_06085 [Candidatus Roizmanbacteria bacterium CG22_combo_CG10-13_8_21_14_all_38_20]|uniref:Transposase IS200-like domain-containing protein n=1 Tax=Candidatus Roizmanbacteria bacterium CG22_combo_CG10-13_8_21_14_all_38_20 TaxID=1974862 RepID=A0A2H0BVJ6_9BACT|nr:hypothetical protein [Candidatus Microgenomates bacterium]PIP61060.1 MAG: hypothetical protein COW99_06085 [Candidatus Roizmanbacteria bacterium CG22_combo_CG10-13_8_21_14_all_38_20]PJC30846.1 MAG: hypothetical protein CO050_04750 [Candidatus Roizmanbacteria bacterium CG_4_9_14_0_2_um_filter_38_17]
MPSRKIPLITQGIYHIFNRSVAGQTIFRNIREYQIFLDLLEYYSFTHAKHRFSHYRRLEDETKKQTLNKLYQQSDKLVDIYSFCIMPNHYHLLLKQLTDDGISKFIRQIQNSYARYINIKTQRNGALLQSPFKSVLIENDEQFIHVARYIHLNPLTSYILTNQSELANLEWCSYKDYCSANSRGFVNTSNLMSYYNSIDELNKFTLNQVDYQRALAKIKHLTLEKSFPNP